jgi:UMF1 family MFS transporter
VQSIKNDRRTIFGWTMYDWANSAYSTVIAGAVLPSYFASEVVGDGGWNGRSGQTLWALAVGLGTLMVFLAMPVIGAIADFSASKLRFLRVFAYGGSLFTTALIFAVSGNVLYTLGFFMLAQVGFVGANVFYDGFLTDISTPDTIDRISSRGFATGYIGGGLYLLIVVLAIQFAPDGAAAARYGVAGTGLWWAGFSAFAFSRLRETGQAETLPTEVRVPRSLVRGLLGLAALLVGGVAALIVAFTQADDPVWFDLLLGLFMIGIIVTVVMIANRMNGPSDGAEVVARRPFAKMAGIGFVRTFATAAKLRAFPQLLLFVLAFMLYNDGVQTTINVSAAYATDTLGLETSDIALILPEGQALPFILTGVAIGVVLGGVQALSRSLYGSMIPEEASAEFYGFYSVFSKFSAVWGPLIFSIVSSNSSSGRPAILSLILFFIVGLVLFSRVDIEAARRSKEQWAFRGAGAELLDD